MVQRYKHFPYWQQNVNSVFTTKNVLVLRKASQVLGVSFELLISYSEEPDLDEIYENIDHKR